jgi:hypothetical protein
MALNQEEIQALENVGLTDLFNEKKALWLKLADDAFKYTEGYFPDGNKIRPDDVVIPLVPALKVCETFTEHCQAKKLPQKYWPKWFGDLILDEYFNNKTLEAKGEAK